MPLHLDPRRHGVKLIGRPHERSEAALDRTPRAPTVLPAQLIDRPRLDHQPHVAELSWEELRIGVSGGAEQCEGTVEIELGMAILRVEPESARPCGAVGRGRGEELPEYDERDA
jgi:hypothetical protein